MNIFGLKVYNQSTEVVITKLCCALLAITAISTSSLLISLHHIPKIQVFHPKWNDKPPSKGFLRYQIKYNNLLVVGQAILFQGNFPATVKVYSETLASFPLLNLLSAHRDQSSREVRIVLHVQRRQALFSDDHTTDSFHNDAKKPSSVSDVRSPVKIFHAVGTSVIISLRALLLLVRSPLLTIWSLAVYSVQGAAAARRPSSTTSFNTRSFEPGRFPLPRCS